MEKFKGYFVPNKDNMCKGSLEDRTCTNVTCYECLYGRITKEQILAEAEYIATHLTAITDLYVPFGLLSKEKQEELKEANNNEGNIQCFGKTWENKVFFPLWANDTIYRLDPKYKSEEQKKAERKAELIKQLEEMGAIVNGKIIM